jgi:hypothetical protein
MRENKVHVHGFHATVLALLGFDRTSSRSGVSAAISSAIAA